MLPNSLDGMGFYTFFRSRGKCPCNALCLLRDYCNTKLLLTAANTKHDHLKLFRAGFSSPFYEVTEFALGIAVPNFSGRP